MHRERERKNKRGKTEKNRRNSNTQLQRKTGGHNVYIKLFIKERKGTQRKRDRERGTEREKNPELVSARI